MCASLLSIFLALCYAVAEANFFEVDMAAPPSRKPMFSDSTFQASTFQLLKRESGYKVPSNDSDFGTDLSVIVPGSDVRCIQDCVEIVKKDNENSSMGCKTLSQLRKCLMACHDGKFPKYLRYHISSFESAYCQGTGEKDGFAVLATQIRNCEKRLHTPRGTYVLTRLWQNCEAILHPDTLEEFCLVLQKCFFDRKFKSLKYYCSPDVSDFYEFEIKSTFAIRQNIFGLSRVTPKGFVIRTVNMRQIRKNVY